MEGRRVEFEAGASVYEPDQPARDLYLIQSGQVRLFQVGQIATPGGAKESARLLEILGPGDWFGAPALARAESYGTRAVAASRATASQVPADRVREALPQRPDAAVELIAELAGKLQSAYADAANLVFSDTEGRLLKTLLQFSRTAAATPQESGEVVLRITHQQLAQAVGAARETVSLTLTQLRQRNLLRTGRNRLSFRPEALEEFSRRRGAQAPAAGQPTIESEQGATADVHRGEAGE
jgi:CRP-like cAMP-binding protein